MTFVGGQSAILNPIYEERYCAFVDVLGFRDLIAKLKNGSISYQEIREALIDFHNSHLHGLGFDVRQLRIQSISDAICVSANNSPDGLLYIVNVLGELSFRLLSRGYFVRGALVKGKLYHDDRTVFGEALVRAYELEQDTVRFPRIMLSSDVLADTDIHQSLFLPNDGSNETTRI